MSKEIIKKFLNRSESYRQNQNYNTWWLEININSLRKQFFFSFLFISIGRKKCAFQRVNLQKKRVI